MDTSFEFLNSTGCLQVIFGPMFSGKTTELMRRIRRYSIAKKKCTVIKYKADTRYDSDQAVTHDSVMCAAVPCTTLSEAEKAVENCDVIGIDEGQFFADIVQYCDKWSNEGKIVVVAALDGTFQRKPFGRVLELIPLAEKVTKLTAVCMLCCDPASFSYRISAEKEVEVIGGADKYLALCRSCYNSNNPVEGKPKAPKKRRHSDLTGILVNPVEKRPKIAV